MRLFDDRIEGMLCLAVLSFLLASPAGASTPSQRDIPVYEQIESAVTQIVANDYRRHFGQELPTNCIETPELALCLDPDTPQEKIDELLKRLPTYEGDVGDRYQRLFRWVTTATDGFTGAIGDPITLTYSFVPDGVMIPSGAGEPASVNVLYAKLNSYFGSPDVWKPIFAQQFAMWAQNIGIKYVEVSDDGASFPNSVGILGSRGDVRISSHNIDGGSNILAYNYYPPNGGDMVLDSSENWGTPNFDYRFLRNVITHEHGHGHGLAHTQPLSCSKLMEAMLCTNFLGPQDDDIRGGMRNYGDFLEPNPSATECTDLGAFTGEMTIATVSITTSADHDWFKFTMNGNGTVDVTVHPVGSAYQVDGVVVWTYKVQDLKFQIRGGVDGADVLIEVNDTIEGLDEVLTDYALPPGNYWVHVLRNAGTSDVQRYDLVMNVTSDPTAAPEGVQPLAGLGLGVFPNPFNPKTTAHFYAPAAGPVSLDVYNVAGGLVRSISGRAESAGWMNMVWNGQNDRGQNVPSGIYFVKAQAGEYSQTVRAALLK